MRRPLVTFVIVVVLAASSSTPLCEISCSIAHEGAQRSTVPAEGLTSAAAGHCHEDAGEAGSGGKSSSPHPCKKGLQHRMELSASVASQIQSQLAPLAESFGGPARTPAVGTVFGVAAGPAPGELIFPSASRVSQTSLRI
jgi:hypothetical protein